MSNELQDQSQTLPKKLLFVTLSCLTASLFVSFFDQTAVTTSLPSIAEDLGHTSLLNSWVGTSYLIANTNFQLLYGRFSDIFGRKQVFLFSLCCLLVGNLVSGFSQNPTMLFVFRGLSGLGGGGVNCLVMITFSDLLTTRERGRYFGFVAATTALGNGLGPLIGGLLAQKASWRWSFWISCPITVVSTSLVVFFVPLKPVTGSLKEKLKLIDWIGFFTSMISTILILVAVSGGGTSWAWKSAVFISLTVVSGIAFVVFLFNEEFFAKIPMIPTYLFKNLQRSVLFGMCFLMGWAYFVDIYYYPLYLQDIRGWSPIMSGVLQLPATCSSSIFGVGVGFINTKYGQYSKCAWAGGAIWTLGTGLKIIFNEHSSIGLLVGSNLIQGLGIGFTFQPTLLALLSHSSKDDRAVVTGLRNFFRCFGGAVGIVICGIIFQSIFRRRLARIAASSTWIDQINSNPIVAVRDNAEVRDAYLHAFRVIMITLTAISGFMFLISLLAHDLDEPIEQAKEEDETSNEFISIVDSSSAVESKVLREKSVAVLEVPK